MAYARIVTVSALLLLCVMEPHPAFAQNLGWQRLTDGLALTVWKPGAACPEVAVGDVDDSHVRIEDLQAFVGP